MAADRLEDGVRGVSLEANRSAESSVPLPAQKVGGDGLATVSSEEASRTRYDLRVLRALRRIIRAVDLHSRKLLAQHKVTGPQLVCLLAVEEHEPVTGSVIARQVHLSPSTVIGILDRLEAKALVRRERDAKDRRLVHVWLTEQGKAVVASAPLPLQDTLAAAMKELPESELATIAESLDRVVEMMEARHIDAAPILETGLIGRATGPAKAVERPDGEESDP